MKDYVIIKKTDIFLASTIKYSHLIKDSLVIDEEYNDEYCTYEGNDTKAKCYLKKVILIDKHFIDIKTGEELFIHTDEYGLVEPPIYRNTIYIVNVYKPINVSDQDLLNANKAYLLFIQKQKMINEKKLVLFPQERIY